MPPRISIITPVYNPPLDVFAAAVESVLAQSFEEWEWILVDDRSPNPLVRDALRELAAREARVTVVQRAVNGGIVAASNDAIGIASGDFLAFMDHDDLLLPGALELVASTLDSHDDIDYLYTDEDKVYPDGSTGEAFLKPDWSPERFRYQMYTAHLSVVRTALVREVGGFREGFDGSQDHDLVLRITEMARTVWHIPRVLYRWRVMEGSTAGDPDAKPYAWDAGLRAVAEHLKRVGIRADVVKGRVPGRYVLLREPDTTTPVSVIIPTSGASGIVGGSTRVYVTEMVRSILASTEHQSIQIVVVYDPNTPSGVLRELEGIAGDRLVLVQCNEESNFGRRCNVGFLNASGDVLLFMHDDMESYSASAIEQLIAPLREAGVGLTGARLLFEDTGHQHAGLSFGGGAIAHDHYQMPMDAAGYVDALWINREVSALSGACVAVTRQTFEAVGGFCETLSLNLTDVDFSMKVRSLGLRLVWLENVVLVHFESDARSAPAAVLEIETIKARWGDFETAREKYASPLLTPAVRLPKG